MDTINVPLPVPNDDKFHWAIVCLRKAPPGSVEYNMIMTTDNPWLMSAETRDVYDSLEWASFQHGLVVRERS